VQKENCAKDTGEAVLVRGSEREKRYLRMAEPDAVTSAKM